jgi:hypothetical protein
MIAADNGDHNGANNVIPQLRLLRIVPHLHGSFRSRGLYAQEFLAEPFLGAKDDSTVR